MTRIGEGGLPEITIKVSRYTNHEHYRKRTHENDITLIKLAKEVDLSIYTPACLARRTDTSTFNGKNALVYGKKKDNINPTSIENLNVPLCLGWGKISSEDPKSLEMLLEVTVPVVSRRTCEVAMSPHITDDMICAGGRRGKDACGVRRIDQRFE